jgi:hypothetical protein
MVRAGGYNKNGWVYPCVKFVPLLLGTLLVVEVNDPASGVTHWCSTLAIPKHEQPQVIG